MILAILLTIFTWLSIIFILSLNNYRDEWLKIFAVITSTIILIGLLAVSIFSMWYFLVK